MSDHGQVVDVIENFGIQEVNSPSPSSSHFPLGPESPPLEGSVRTLQDAPIQPETRKVQSNVPGHPLHKREGTLLGTDPTCLPPITASRARTLILCFDGTGDQFDNDNSNIVEIFSMLKKNDKHVQMCYYQAGIGTYVGRTSKLPGMKTLSKKADEAVAWALKKHVKDGYEFLMQNYVDGDKICLFGFSRGAYTARALAGMLHKVGLLPADNKQQIPFAWRMFKNVSDDGWKLSRQFKKQFCTDVSIEFLGVFDTVSSVGLLGKKLPFTGSNFSIHYFRQAMALDERRARFKVNHWTPPSPADEAKWNTKRGKKSVRKGHEETYKEPDDVQTDVKEVWFSGCHADVGGGSVKNETKHCLARIPLRWMVRETFRTNSGILWDIDGLKRLRLDPDLLYPEVIVPQTPPPNMRTDSQLRRNPSLKDIEQVETERTTDGDEEPHQHEHNDALSPLFDQLSLAWSWWVLEVLPAKGKRQAPPDYESWKDYYYINMGKGREFPRDKTGQIARPLIHRSVQVRMENEVRVEDEKKKKEKSVQPKAAKKAVPYKWKARGNIEPIWVD